MLKAFAEATCAPVLAVAGNVDDEPGASQLLPDHRVLDVAGWKLLLLHIVAPSPKSKGGTQSACQWRAEQAEQAASCEFSVFYAVVLSTEMTLHMDISATTHEGPSTAAGRMLHHPWVNYQHRLTVF